MAVRPSLEDLLKEVPREKLCQPCRDDHLSEIALSVTKWKSIAPFLGLTEAEEENIEKNCGENETQKIGMLRKWKKKFGTAATYRKLSEVFWKLGRTDLVERVCELLPTDNSSSSSSEEFHNAAEKFEPVIPLEKTTSEQPACTIVASWVDTSRPPKISLNSYAEYLKGRYSTEVPKFFTLQWPPPLTQKVFNLAMIGHEAIQRGAIDEKLIQLTLRGNVDDILRMKSSIQLKNLFKLDARRRKIILVEGAPGAGKSTLAWHICQKWESGELFQEFKIIVFVQLRDPAVQSATSLADILPARSQSMRTHIVSEVEFLNGRDMLFVLDGWDECGAGLQAHHLFQQLICNPEEVSMRFSSLLITSRPIASGELQQYASSRVEIVGFTPAEVKTYFRESIGDEAIVQKLHDHLRERPVIEASCYLPLNAAIVVHLFLALNHTLPDTLYEVFLSLVCCCIIRHLTKEAEEGQKVPCISSLDDLPPDIQEPFNNICTMAYHGVMKNKVTFSASDLRSFNLPTELSTLSLIQGVQRFMAFDQSVSYNFLHLSVQEQLAALHISKLPAAKQIHVFNHLFGQPRLAAVFQFYAAFTKLQTEGVRAVVARIVRKKEKSLLVNLLHCLYEAQDSSLCEFVSSHLIGELDLQLTSLSPMDCLVVGHFLSCVCLTTSVNLCNCSLDEYRVSYLVGKLFRYSRSLKSFQMLDLSHNNLSDGGVVHVVEILRYNHNTLKTLNLSYCGLGDQGMKSLASFLEMNSSLELLALSRNCAVTGVGLLALGESLKNNRGLRILRLLWLDNISDNDWKQFMLCLQENEHLTELVLSYSSTHEVVQQETMTVNDIRSRKRLPRLKVI